MSVATVGADIIYNSPASPSSCHVQHPEYPVRRLSIVALSVIVCLSASGLFAQAPSPLTNQLDRYLAGEFEAVVDELVAQGHFDDLLDRLDHEARAWIDAGAAGDRARRELAAATFALQAAREATGTDDWKWVQRVNLNLPTARPSEAYLPGILPQTYTAPNAIWWKPAPRLLEWGCKLMRTSSPGPIERIWQLASVAVAERAGDFEFLIGSPWEARGNPQDEPEHLAHVIKRFPGEPRFALAQAIAVEWRTWPVGFRTSRSRVIAPADAMSALQKMTKDDAIGPEASLRLGVLRLRTGKPDDALPLFDGAEAATRDPYLVYLARYFRGQALERKRLTGDAEQAYRGALAAIPRAQSATVALSALLAKAGRQREASDVVETSLSEPPVLDPWREYELADYRFWPELLARLHAEIHSTEGVAVR
jgi:tetratricopeptide (TPR) repeat protein